MPMTPFLNMFGRSPIRPLEEHMAKVHACVKELYPFFLAVLEKNWDQSDVIKKNIVHLENEADNMKRELRLHLPNSLFMPVPRGDILALLNVQDRLANKAKDIAGLVFGRQMQLPDNLIENFLDFLQQCIKASKQANKAIHELDELLETGFSGSEIKLVDGMITELAHLEHTTDEQQIQLRNSLFKIEEGLPPVHVIFLYKIFEWTGELADGAREVGDRLQILVAR